MRAGMLPALALTRTSRSEGVQHGSSVAGGHMHRAHAVAAPAHTPGLPSREAMGSLKGAPSAGCKGDPSALTASAAML